jgi:hypothetical protein
MAGMKVLPIVLLAMLAGFGDAFGFSRAPHVWAEHGLSVPALAQTLFGFLVGAVAYLALVRLLLASDIRTPEVQAMIWLAACSVGVGAASGRAYHWPATDKVVGALVIAGIAWLAVRVH